MVEVYDHDTFGKVTSLIKIPKLHFFSLQLIYWCLKIQDKMGRCIMTLTRAILDGELRDDFDIDGTERGRISLYLKWTSKTIVKE